MKKTALLLVCLMTASASIGSLQAADVTAAERIAPAVKVTAPVMKKETKDVEMVFVLDTTGSMGGLIQGAKTKIWSIVNDVMQNQAQKTNVKIGLVAYRDRGDDYVTQITDLNDDLDAVYSKLMTFKAIGGGDEPEDVRQALAKSLSNIQWSKPGSDVKRIIFLVGDARPHTDYTDYPSTADTAKKAKEQGIIINTIQCGNLAETDKYWREIAQYANGEYFSIAQNGGTHVIVTPYDDELKKLGTKLDRQYIPYGGKPQRLAAARAHMDTVDSITMAAPVEAMAARAVNKSVNSFGYAGDDLIQGIENGTITLANVKKEELPDAMQSMNLSEQEAYVHSIVEQRQQLRADIAALSKKRNAYIRNNAKNAQDSKDSFDTVVSQALQKQLQ